MLLQIYSVNICHLFIFPWRDDSNDMLHFPIRRIFSEIFDFKPANFQKWPGKIRLDPIKARDVKSGTEVILLVSICYKSLLFGAAYEHKYECKMPSLCVVFGCSNTPDPKSGIIIHKIPYDGYSRPEAIKRRKRWVDFVKRKHAKLEPSTSSWIYSKHLEDVAKKMRRCFIVPNIVCCKRRQPRDDEQNS